MTISDAEATIFIIDPLCTMPLAVGMLAAPVLRRNPQRAWRWNLAGLALSSLYLAWSAGAKLYADHRVRDILVREGLHYVHLQTQPTPFNTLLWRVAGVDGDGYFEGLWSLVSPDKGLTLTHHKHRPDLLGGIEQEPAMKRLRWFTKGLSRVGARGRGPASRGRHASDGLGDQPARHCLAQTPVPRDRETDC